MFDLHGMTALVTGASGGIGSSIARGFAAQGARLVVSGSNAEKLRVFRDELDEHTPQHLQEVDHVAIACNLSDPDQVEKLVPAALETLGKIERFWGTLWRECVETAVFRGLDDARRRIGLFIDHYNFQRPHSGAGGLVPADRFFEATPAVKATLAALLFGFATNLQSTLSIVGSPVPSAVFMASRRA